MRLNRPDFGQDRHRKRSLTLGVAALIGAVVAMLVWHWLQGKL